jgi:uncharacterized protein YggE
MFDLSFTRGSSMLVHSRSSAVAALALFATSALSAGTLDAQQPAPPPIPQIVTSGQGESKIAPDRARIEISVQTRALTAAAAGSENARKQQAVLDALKKLGFAGDQLSTVNYSLYPEMQYDKEGRTARVVGYTAMNTVRVEVRDLTLVGKAIDASLSAGANVISSLTFYASNTDEARRAALALAVSRARADADAVAKAAGGSVGQLLEISTGEVRLPIPMNKVMMSRAGVAGQAADATPIDPAEQTISAYITARWAFAGAR